MNRRRRTRHIQSGIMTIAIALCAFALSTARAVPISSLPDFSPLFPYTTFGSFNNNNLVTINGNTGTSQNGIFLAPNAQINGTAFLGAGVTPSIGAPTHITGGIVQPMNFSIQTALVQSGSSTLAGFAANYSLGNVTTGQNFNAVGSGAVTVIDLNSLSLGGTNNITLTGGANDYFVLNIAHGLALSGSASISGIGVDPSHIFVNLYDNSGNLGTAAHINDMINGVVLVPFDSVTFHSLNGAIWSGNGEVTLMSGATVNGFVMVPDGGSTQVCLGLGLLAIAAFRRAKLGCRASI